jgi:hypothetical protein
MKSFSELLNEFNITLQKFNTLNYNKLRIALPSDKIDTLLKKIPILDEAVYDLYKWKNGVEKVYSLPMIFDFQSAMLSIQEMMELYEAKTFERWTEMNGLIPLFRSSEGECFLYNNNEGENYKKIHLYSVPLLSITEPAPYYDSLYTMFQTHIAYYEKRGFFFNPATNCIDEDIDLMVKIYEEFNPICDFYNQESW